MIINKGYILWDDVDGYKIAKVYLDMPSALIGLREHYTEYFINNNRAKIKEIELVSYQ